MPDGRPQLPVLSYRPQFPRLRPAEHSPEALTAFWWSSWVALLILLIPLLPTEIRGVPLTFTIALSLMAPPIAVISLFDTQHRRWPAAAGLGVLVAAWGLAWLAIRL